MKNWRLPIPTTSTFTRTSSTIVPAPARSFTRPNLPRLIAEIELGLLAS